MCMRLDMVWGAALMMARFFGWVAYLVALAAWATMATAFGISLAKLTQLGVRAWGWK